MTVSGEVLAQRFKIVLSVTIGIGFLVFAAISARYTRDFVQSSVVVPGRVVNLKFGGHHPEVEFVTKDGRRLSLHQSAFFSVDVGDQIQVRYRLDAPLQTARLDVFSSIWGDSVVLSLMGLAVIAGSMLSFFRYQKSSKG